MNMCLQSVNVCACMRERESSSDIIHQFNFVEYIVFLHYAPKGFLKVQAFIMEYPNQLKRTPKL